MGAGHASDSAVQRRVEEHILGLASEELHFELKHRVWTEARTTLARWRPHRRRRQRDRP